MLSTRSDGGKPASRLRFTIGHFLWSSVALAVGLAAIRGRLPNLAATAGAALWWSWGRAQEPDVALPVAASLGLGPMAFVACYRRPGWAPPLVEGAYLLAVGAAVFLGGGEMARGDLLLLLTGLAYPTVLGAGLGRRLAPRDLPTDRTAAPADDLVVPLLIVPLLLILPALAFEPLRAALAASGWLN